MTPDIDELVSEPTELSDEELDLIKSAERPLSQYGFEVDYRDTFGIGEKIQLIDQINRADRRSVPLSELVATDDVVGTELVRSYAESKEFEDRPIDAVEYNGDVFILDGHHRSAAASLSGEQSIDARVIPSRVVESVVSKDVEQLDYEDLLGDAQDNAQRVDDVVGDYEDMTEREIFVVKVGESVVDRFESAVHNVAYNSYLYAEDGVIVKFAVPGSTSVVKSNIVVYDECDADIFMPSVSDVLLDRLEEIVDNTFSVPFSFKETGDPKAIFTGFRESQLEEFVSSVVEFANKAEELSNREDEAVQSIIEDTYEELLTRKELRNLRRITEKKRLNFLETAQVYDYVFMDINFRLAGVAANRDLSEIRYDATDNKGYATFRFPVVPDTFEDTLRDVIDEEVSSQAKLRFRSKGPVLDVKQVQPSTLRKVVKEFVYAYEVFLKRYQEFLDDPSDVEPQDPLEALDETLEYPDVGSFAPGDEICLLDEDYASAFKKFEVEAVNQDSIVIFDGGRKRLTQEDIVERGLPYGDMPQQLRGEFPDWFSNGVSVEVVGERGTVSNLQGNVFELSRETRDTVIAIGNTFYMTYDGYRDRTGSLSGSRCFVPELGVVDFVEYEWREDSENVFIFREGGEEVEYPKDTRVFFPVEVSVVDDIEVQNNIESVLGEDRAERCVSAITEYVDSNPFNLSEIKAEAMHGGLFSPAPVATYTFETDTITINPDLADDETMRKSIEKSYESGHLAGKTLEHLVMHETAHAYHYVNSDEDAIDLRMDWGDTKYTNNDKIVASHVSEYAEASPAEFVAELCALFGTGRFEEEIDERHQHRVLDLLERLGGPRPEEVTSINE